MGSVVYHNRKGERIESALTNPEALEKVRHLSGKFPQSLVWQNDEGNRALTGEQWFWVHKLANQTAKPREQEQLAQNGEMETILRLFVTAKKHLKYPKIRLLADGKLVSLSMAGEKARVPGLRSDLSSCNRGGVGSCTRGERPLTGEARCE